MTHQIILLPREIKLIDLDYLFKTAIFIYEYVHEKTMFWLIKMLSWLKN